MVRSEKGLWANFGPTELRLGVELTPHTLILSCSYDILLLSPQVAWRNSSINITSCFWKVPPIRFGPPKTRPFLPPAGPSGCSAHILGQVLSWKVGGSSFERAFHVLFNDTPLDGVGAFARAERYLGPIWCHTPFLGTRRHKFFEVVST